MRARCRSHGTIKPTGDSMAEGLAKSRPFLFLVESDFGYALEYISKDHFINTILWCLFYKGRPSAIPVVD